MYMVTTAARISSKVLDSEAAERLRRALERGLHAGRHADVLLHPLDDLHRIAQRHAGREVERHHHRRELADVVDRQARLRRSSIVRHARQPHLPAVGGRDVNLSSASGPIFSRGATSSTTRYWLAWV